LIRDAYHEGYGYDDNKGFPTERTDDQHQKQQIEGNPDKRLGSIGKEPVEKVIVEPV